MNVTNFTFYVAFQSTFQYFFELYQYWFIVLWKYFSSVIFDLLPYSIYLAWFVLITFVVISSYQLFHSYYLVAIKHKLLHLIRYYIFGLVFGYDVLDGVYTDRTINPLPNDLPYYVDTRVGELDDDVVDDADISDNFQVKSTHKRHRIRATLALYFHLTSLRMGSELLDPEIIRLESVKFLTGNFPYVAFRHFEPIVSKVCLMLLAPKKEDLNISIYKDLFEAQKQKTH